MTADFFFFYSFFWGGGFKGNSQKEKNPRRRIPLNWGIDLGKNGIHQEKKVVRSTLDGWMDGWKSPGTTAPRFFFLEIGDY